MRHTTKLVLGICLLLTTTIYAQTVRRVTRFPGVTGPNIYTTVQAAHDDAVNGDIIQVEPSDGSYGNLTCSKRLTIVGNGFFHDQNTDDATNSFDSKLENVTFSNGSASSKITGIRLEILTTTVPSVTVARCRINNYVAISYDATANTVGDNTTINGCYIGQAIQGSYINQAGGGTRFPSGLVLTNSILFSSILQYFQAATIQNNVLKHGVNWLLDYVNNSTIRNNIIRVADGSWIFQQNSTGNTVTNNIATLYASPTYLPTGNGNQNSVDITTVFIVGDPFTEPNTYDANFRLAATGSPATGAGQGGIDCGAFGGTTPYKLAGQPAVPYMTTSVNSGAARPAPPYK